MENLPSIVFLSSLLLLSLYIIRFSLLFTIYLNYARATVETAERQLLEFGSLKRLDEAAGRQKLRLQIFLPVEGCLHHQRPPVTDAL